MLTTEDGHEASLPTGVAAQADESVGNGGRKKQIEKLREIWQVAVPETWAATSH